MGFLLDTDHLSALVNDPNGRCAQRIRRAADQAFTSVIVIAEVRFGLASRPSARLRELTDAVIGSIRIEPWESPADVHYGEIRAHLQRMGTPIGTNDLFIAAHALALEATLVSANEREFLRVPGLKLENWAS
jgi:tRNA(fMet)-specific endonuclease VapC